MTQLLMGGGGGVVVPLPGGTAYDSRVLATATATVTAARDGTLTGSGNLSSFAHAWYRNGAASIGDTYWVKATVTAGSLSTGSTSWQQLTANRSWTVQRTSGGGASATITLAISTAGSDATIVSSGSYQLNADYEV